MTSDARSGILACVTKPLIWLGSSLDDLRAFPEDTRGVMGYALYLAQTGGRHPRAKPLRGFSGAGVIEVVDDFDGNTFRVVYTVKLPNAVYVLHAFQKKSKRGIATPQHEVDLIAARLRRAQEHSYAQQTRDR